MSRPRDSVQSVTMSTPIDSPSIDDPSDATMPAASSIWPERMVAVAARLDMFLASLDIALNVALPSLA